eukprot:CAMPEP_0175057338 /NCGR_PEP_ID=MMETSP0052_2-20121109/11208_1 /TAXON_ID=51329 ORGANISM="Polytomella parva, Strain SAG 63-3" /NCGR_SAMPLE_ID=MMETSP0052_2 /ASSEMBLY_ACC=CAM_ASM_000194 /LENGTH=56 /DNA_ID=CAMNT_0016322539 /DNA_START=162 /DNA_END=329 /DNA_ORIENTATION=-
MNDTNEEAFLDAEEDDEEEEENNAAADTDADRNKQLRISSWITSDGAYYQTERKHL